LPIARIRLLWSNSQTGEGVRIKLENVDRLPTIMGYDVMSTPGVVIGGVVVHAGGVPSRSKVEGWLR